jgi:aspartate dehydrogenase
MSNPVTTVAIAGLGAIGFKVALCLDAGIPGFALQAVAARDPDKARAKLQAFAAPPRVTSLEALAEADIVIEAAPAAVFTRIARPVIAGGRILLACSAGALMHNMSLVEDARTKGARIIVPTGALLGLDAVRAAAQGRIHSAIIVSRKPPLAWAGAPYAEAHGFELRGLTEPLRLFRGNALEAAEGFPANVNVAAALALAGIGPQKTEVELWADPGVTHNTHTIRVESEAARFSMTIEGIPSPENPRTGLLTPLSVIACLRGLQDTLRIGS